MRPINRLLVDVFLILMLSTTGSAKNTTASLYVATNGNDSNPGTIDSPLRTIQHAADIAKPGETVYVRACFYCQQLAVKFSGIAQQGFFTFQSQPG